MIRRRYDRPREPTNIGSCEMGLSLPPKIQDGSAVVGVIGLGYVGLPLLHAFHSAGFRVIGFDVDPEKIEALRRGENYLRHLGPSMVKEMLSAGEIVAAEECFPPGQ